MNERKNSTEINKQDERRSEELNEASAEQREVIRDFVEHKELESNKNLEDEIDAHKEASELADKADKKKEAEVQAHVEKHNYRGAPSKKQLRESFNNQMDAVREELGLGGKITSRIIHNPLIETASNFISSTVARPNALLSGSIMAFVTVTALYVLAKHYGFQLSGFETIAAFVLGWIVGTFYDYLVTVFRRHKH